MPVYMVYRMDNRDDVEDDDACCVVHKTSSAADAEATAAQLAARETNPHITYTTDAPEIVL